MAGRGLRCLRLTFLSLSLLLSSSVALAQVSVPFQAQGVPPTEFSPIYVTFYLDRLIAVDDHQYIFEAVTYIRFSWIDTRAAALVTPVDETDIASCTRPCQTLVPDSGSSQASCCDKIWLPGTNFRNAYVFPDGRTESEIVTVGGVNNSAVQWLKVLHGVYYTPMSFRNFPFDKQSLVISLEAIDHRAPYIASSIGSKVGEDVIERRGNDLSSWMVESVSTDAYNRSLAVTLEYGTFSHPEDPLPLKPEAGMPPFFYPNFVITIEVSRLSSYYVYNIIVPMGLCVSMSWITFFLSAEHVDTRLQIVVTLFLALTAMQFVVNDQLPKSSYITALHIQVVVSYATISVVGLEGLAVYYLTRKDIRRKRKRSAAEAMAAALNRRRLTRKYITNPASGAANTIRSIGTLFVQTSALSKRARQASSTRRQARELSSEVNASTNGLVATVTPPWQANSPSLLSSSTHEHGWPSAVSARPSCIAPDGHEQQQQPGLVAEGETRLRPHPASHGEDGDFNNSQYHDSNNHDNNNHNTDDSNSHNRPKVVPKNLSAPLLVSLHSSTAGLNNSSMCGDNSKGEDGYNDVENPASCSDAKNRNRGWLTRMMRIRTLVHEDFGTAVETVNRLDFLSLLILPVLYIGAAILTFVLNHEQGSYPS
eukprot:jgi/Chlat1/1688/Chrsp127S00093